MRLDRELTPRQLEQVGVLAAVVLYVATVMAHADHVPIWDGLTYARDCLLKVVSEPLSFLGLNCFRHPTAAYVLLVALPQYLDPGNTLLLHGAHAALGCCSVLALYFIVRRLHPGEARWPERVLVTALYAGFPVVIANTLHPNPDFGMLVFFLLCLALVLHGRLALAALAGLGLVYTKEPGVLLYLCIVGIHAVVHVTRAEAPPGQRLRQLAGLWPLGLPPLLIAGYYLYRSFLAEPVLWATGDTADGDILRSFTSFELLDPTFLSYVRGIFLINFNWFMSAFVAALIGLRAVQHLLGLPASGRDDGRGRSRDALMVVVLFALVFLLLTRFPTFTNLRYLLPVYPLLMLIFHHALCVLIRSRRLRLGILGVALLLAYTTNFATLDPLSRWIYGTFDFGGSAMLKMTSVTRECCGHGRDQLVYNLQFTKFHHAINHVMETVKPTRETVILTHSGFRKLPNAWADYNMIGSLDRKTHHRTLRAERDIGFKTDNLRALWDRPNKPRVLYYLDLPNYDSSRELNGILHLYRVAWVRWFGDPGHQLRLYKMIRR